MGNVRFIVIDETECVYQDSEESPLCGDSTIRALNMPFGIDAMPLCPSHAFEYRDWTFDDTIREFVEVMTEEEEIIRLKESFDDDF